MNSLHIELTNRCILACPACPRTEWANLLKRPVTKQDLNYLLLDNFLNCVAGKNINHFLLCGDYGDPIYYPQLIEFLTHFRSSKKFTIVTNGSRQSNEFWQKLSSILTEEDNIVFSIDGLEDTNHLYRKNSHWPSIMQGLDIMSAGPANIIWQTIVFRFNQSNINEIKDFAESKNAKFKYSTTHRFGDDSLVPTTSLVDVSQLYRGHYETQNIEIEPKCSQIDVIPTVGADGIYYPCDWLRNPNTFYKSQLWKQKDRWLNKLHIESTTYDQAMCAVQDWANYVKNNSLTGGPVDVLCKMSCRKGQCNG
jgi:MoaA/NifB/PqqE/SkfB family radical SAM enzyme